MSVLRQGSHLFLQQIRLGILLPTSLSGYGLQNVSFSFVASVSVFLVRRGKKNKFLQSFSSLEIEKSVDYRYYQSFTILFQLCLWKWFRLQEMGDQSLQPMKKFWRLTRRMCILHQMLVRVQASFRPKGHLFGCPN